MRPSTPTIGFVTRNFESPYHTPMFYSFHQRLGKRGYRLLGIVATPGEVAAARIAYDHVDGWIVINTALGIDALGKSGKPLVLISASSEQFPCVVSDNRGGTSAAISHLIEQGRTRIGFVTYGINPDFQERYAAYCDTLAAHGLALDPALVVDIGSYLVSDTYQMVRRRLAEGLRFDAVFCANDSLGFGTMQAILEANLRIPEDVAVVGFDDTAEAQFSTPPLTSVRQNTTELGRVALDLLLNQIEQGAVPLPCTTVATQLIVRQSSMPVSHTVSALNSADRYRDANWKALLARDLVQKTIYPVPLTPNAVAEQLWPGIEGLVAALEATLEGSEASDIPQGIWEHIPGLEHGNELMRQVIKLLSDAALQRLDETNCAAAKRLTLWLIDCEHQVMQQQLMRTINRAEQDRQIFRSESTLLNYVGRTDANLRMIEWMAQSRADWATLALWRTDAEPGDPALAISSVYARETGVSPSKVQIAPAQFPPLELLSAPVRDSLEYLIKLSPLASPERQWGYLAEAERFVWAFNETTVNRNAYIVTALERDELMESLRERQESMQEAYERERNLADTIRELGCPLIPLLKGVLLVPLIGAIDRARASQIIERVLEGVAREQAEHVLLDITGVPLVDSEVASALIQTTRAVALLGAKATLVGVRPEIAQSIVGLGSDLGMIDTRSSLASAVQGWLRP